MSLHVRELREQSERPKGAGDPAMARRAHHEAAHAALAVRLGAPLEPITIEVGPHERGRCGHHAGHQVPITITSTQIEKVIVLLLAGFAAESIISGGLVGVWLGSDDINAACSWASQFAKEAAGPFIDRLQRRTRDLVSADWDLVEALADALLLRGTLLPEEITEIATATVAVRAVSGDEHYPDE